MLTITDKFIVTDIETNGLLDDVTEFHCGWCYDTSSDTWTPFASDGTNQGFKGYVEFLESKVQDGYTLVFHNGIKYDIPCIKKLIGRRLTFNPWENVLDTLVLSRLVYAEIKDIDMGLMRKGVLPPKLFGAHSLKAWGYRLGELKGTYGEQEEAWDHFSDEMLTYCKQDVNVTLQLLNKLLKKNYPIEAIDLEHNIAWVMAKQERNGFCFDVHKATELYATLSSRREELKTHLVDAFGSWKVYKGDKVYKKDNAKRGIKAGVPYPIYEEVTFNPNSRDHIAKVLQERGWKPEVLTESGKVQVNEDTLQSAMFIPETKEILELLLIQKRISQLAEGDFAWLKMMKEDKDGIVRIHGSVNPNGAVTGRATHAFPNVAQVPAGRAPYGMECRELFKSPDSWYQVGVDASGLELRCFSHFLYPFDDGEYADVVLNGDIHTHNQKMAGLPTRDQAKTMIYCMLYGGGDAKLGAVIGGSASDGKALKQKFFNGVPAYKKLLNSIEKSLISDSQWFGGINKVTWKKRVKNGLSYTHCVVGLDGRPVYVRSPHSALNTVLQSSGALVCKKWVCLVEENMRKAGYKHGWSGDFAMMAWIHDEVQIACRTKEIAEDCVRIAQESMRQVQEFFKFRIQLDTEGKIGRNWHDTH